MSSSVSAKRKWFAHISTSKSYSLNMQKEKVHFCIVLACERRKLKFVVSTDVFCFSLVRSIRCESYLCNVRAQALYYKAQEHRQRDGKNSRSNEMNYIKLMISMMQFAPLRVRRNSTKTDRKSISEGDRRDSRYLRAYTLLSQANIVMKRKREKNKLWKIISLHKIVVYFFFIKSV